MYYNVQFQNEYYLYLLPIENMKYKALKITLIVVVVIIVLLNLFDNRKKIIIPVEGATYLNWDNDSYWYYPWGKSIVHRGIDIFGDLNTEIISPINGIIIDNGYSSNGGNYIYILSFDLKLYYFAHLSKSNVSTLDFVKKRDVIGLMGDTGNAKFAPFHLHFSIFSAIPIFKYFDLKPIKGWQKMFYLNPSNYFPNK